MAFSREQLQELQVILTHQTTAYERKLRDQKKLNTGLNAPRSIDEPLEKSLESIKELLAECNLQLENFSKK